MRHSPDVRVAAIALAVLLTAGGGILIDRLSSTHFENDRPTSDPHPGSVLATDARAQNAHRHFQQAVVALRTASYETAKVELQSVLRIYPDLPEAHVNMGFALLGLADYAAASRSFDRASDLRPTLIAAYYGLALAEEGRGDFGAALAAMRTYAHLATESDAHLPQALAAIKRWQSPATEDAR